MNPDDLGIEFANHLKNENMRKYLLNGAGLCIGDFDGDNLPDIYAVCQDGPNKLFRQTSKWKFEDVTHVLEGHEESDLWGTGASFADVNNDGHLDLYVCNINGANQLYINDGNGRFTRGTQFGLDFPGPTTSASFADFDNDGDLDVYLLNNRIFSIAEDSKENDLKIITRGGKQEVHPDFRNQYFLLEGRVQEAGDRDLLFRNDGNKFTNVTESAGIDGYDMGLSATWWDYNNDGLLDLYVANDLKSPDHLYKNLGDGKFDDVIEDSVGHTPWFSMGSDAADINNDGRLDLICADMSSTTHYKQKTTMGEMGKSAWFLVFGKPRQFMRNTCYINSGMGRFWEAANLTGLDSTDWTWSVKLNDYDCDGWVDAYFTNGVARNMNDSDLQRAFAKMREEGHDKQADEQILEMPPLNEKNLFFQNKGDLKFENVADSWGANDLGASQGCAVADFDRDGDLDLIVNHMNQPLGVYRNDTADGNRIVIRLVGTKSNSFGVGAMVTIETENGDKFIRQNLLARGYMSADEPVVHFGLGDIEKIEKLTVNWPSGIQQVFTDLESNNLYTVTEVGELVDTDRGANSKPLFAEASDELNIPFKHTEIPFDDFQHQPLLPNKLSQLGGGIAWGDINGDGKLDCYICGARGQIGALLTRNEDRFEIVRGPWSENTSKEEMSALFMDFDSDGDLDLYVTSGGYESEAGSKLYSDNLYVNHGDGSFENADKDVLPESSDSGSCVCSVDYDRDGDLDLFVGSRMIPKQWPLPANSRLLRNESGKFVDATLDDAAEIADLGLVTGAVWSDVNNDGWVDLVVTQEWGNVALFLNESGKLVDKSERAKLKNGLGWWNSISSGDVDNDGDMDFVVMNTGLNTKYHADLKHPITLFANDFDENGRIDLVESEWEGDKCFPIRGKSCSTHAMPFVSEKFETYHEFALAELTDIYGAESLDDAQQFVANQLASVLLINDGSGTFETRELPRLAQISPGFGVEIEDVDGDGFNDILIAQNFMHPQPETGQMDGGLGLLLKGNGNGEFKSIGPSESGIIMPDQSMGLTALDVDGDNDPDFVATVNDGPVRIYRNKSKHESVTWISVSVVGPPGNTTGIGSRIFLSGPDKRSQEIELTGGEGYLSQGPGIAYFAVQDSEDFEFIQTRLPSGKSVRTKLEPGKRSYKIQSESTTEE